MSVRFAVFATVLTLTSCGSPNEPYHRTLYTFGTLAGISIYEMPRHSAVTAADRVEQRLAELNRNWHAWGEGDLGTANRRLATETEATLGPELGQLVQRSLALRTLSGGRFDPTVGSLVEIWGFHDTEAGEDSPPDAQAITERLLIEPPQVLPVSAGYRLVVSQPGLVLDLGGIAKGAALAQAGALLRTAGVRHAMIDLGGDILVIDKPPRRGFRVGIRHPRHNGVIGVVTALDGEAVVTSGDYERYYENQGKRYHHIIDPESGYPTEGAMAVTVVATDAVLADAAATALMIAGRESFRDVAAALGVETVALVDRDGELHLTEKMRERLESDAEDPRTSTARHNTP